MPCMKLNIIDEEETNMESTIQFEVENVEEFRQDDMAMKKCRTENFNVSMCSTAYSSRSRLYDTPNHKAGYVF